MVATNTELAQKTLDGLVSLLLNRQASVSHSAEALRREASEALSQRDVSDLLDHQDPAGDADTTTILMLAEHADGCLWEVEEALLRLADGTYGLCTRCGERIPVVRLRALPAAALCVGCSDRSSRRIDVALGNAPSGSA